MARTLDPAAHALRREAFVDAALRLIQAKGYEQMSLRDVLEELDASKGAFYHYFDSRVALLEAVVERMVDAATATLEPVVNDPDRTARQKLEGVFSGLTRWKTDRKELMVEIGRIWLSDENAIVRDRFRQLIGLRLTPLLARIVRQGMAEGVFTTSAAEPAAGVLVSLVLALNETATRLYVARQANAVSFEQVERTIAAYVEAFERVLGIPPGSWPATDPQVLRDWFSDEEHLG
jgi:AcrR family transcriptional regulator